MGGGRVAAVRRTADIDAHIFRTPVPSIRTSDEWVAITRHLCEELSRVLGVELSVEDSMIVDDTTLSLTVCSRSELAGPLRIRYRGIVGLAPIDGAPYVSAVLFVYSSGLRLSVDGDEASFLAWVYERSDASAGQWRLDGWQSDGYGEYAGFAELPDRHGSDVAPG
jgi:hypothetical protein